MKLLLDTKVLESVKTGDVIVTKNNEGQEYMYLVGHDVDGKYRLMNLENNYIYSIAFRELTDIKDHVESAFSEKIQKVIKGDRLQLKEVK